MQNENKQNHHTQTTSTTHPDRPQPNILSKNTNVKAKITTKYQYQTTHKLITTQKRFNKNTTHPTHMSPLNHRNTKHTTRQRLPYHKKLLTHPLHINKNKETSKPSAKRYQKHTNSSTDLRQTQPPPHIPTFHKNNIANTQQHQLIIINKTKQNPQTHQLTNYPKRTQHAGLTQNTHKHATITKTYQLQTLHYHTNKTSQQRITKAQYTQAPYQT